MDKSTVFNTMLPTPASQSPRARSAPALPWKRKVFSFPVFMGALLVLGAVIGARFNLPDSDMWWHVTVGKHILATHTLPTSDTYSFTAPGTPWMAYEWLGEVALAAADRLGGLCGVEALLLFLGALFTVLLYSYATLMSGKSKAAFVCTAILLPVLSVFFTPRPQLIGYIFLALTLICLERYRRGLQRQLWVLPPLFLLWVNTHGSFVFGLTVLGIYGVSGLREFHLGQVRAEPWTVSQRRHLALVFLLSVMALVVTPYGTRLAAYPLRMAFSQPINLANINEWQALGFQFWQTKLILLLILVFWFAHSCVRLSYRLEYVLLLLLAVYACFLHRRFVPFLILIFVPLFARLIERWIPPYEAAIDHFVINAFLMVLIALGIAKLFPTQSKLDPIVRERYPAGAVEYLRDHPVPRPVLNDYNWGGYLIWSPNYKYKVFVDGRADFYEYAGVLSDYFDIAGVKPDALFMLRKYGVQSCLVAQDAPLATLLATQKGWKKVYQDKMSVVMVHQEQ